MSGGKQYRVSPGDRILVDRLSDELGASIKLGRVLLVSDGDGPRLGKALEGVEVDAKVIGHPRGPRTEGIRYKSKKRVRVHHGGRSHLTALEIIAVAGVGVPAVEEEEAKSDSKRKGRAAGRAQGAPVKTAPRKKAEPKAEAKPAAAEEEAEPAVTEKKPARRRSAKKEES